MFLLAPLLQKEAAGKLHCNIQPWLKMLKVSFFFFLLFFPGTLSTAESKELKRLRRVLKNRLAAQQFRKRQKEHLEGIVVCCCFCFHVLFSSRVCGCSAELERAAVVEEQRRDTTMERIRSLKEKNERLRLEIRKSLDSIVLEKGASLM